MPTASHLDLQSDEFIQYDQVLIPSEPFNAVLIDLLKKEEWDNKYTSDHVQRRLLEMIADLKANITSLADVEARLTDLANEIQSFNSKFHVFFPLEGIQLQAGPITIGLITFEQIDEAKCQEFCNHLGDDSANEYIPLFKERLRESIGNRACAHFSAIAEESRVRELGEVELERVLDLLRFAITLQDPSRNIGFGLLGEVPRGRRMIPAIDESSHLTARHEAAGAFRDLIIDDHILEGFRGIGLFEMSEVLRKSENSCTDFERCLITAIRWCAIARNQIEREGEFLGLISAVETLLTPKDGSPITSSISESAARILGDNLEGRKTIKRRMKELYRLRGKLTHGERVIVVDQDAMLLRKYVILLVSRMIRQRGRFETKQALLDWLEDERLR